jgi:hypothetical protein
MEVRLLPEAEERRRAMTRNPFAAFPGALPEKAVDTNKSDFALYKRGRQDGEAGLPLASIADIYIQGYILGRMKALKIKNAQS